MQETKIIYLAIPYTFDVEKSFEVANKVSAQLMQDGHIVFSPVSHAHKIADHLPENLRYDQEFWMKQDLAVLERCDELYVVVLDDEGLKKITNSEGVVSEVRFAATHNMKTTYIKENCENNW